MQLHAAGAGRPDESDGEALVVGHRDDGGLAVSRQALEPDVLCVDRLVGFEVVERAAGAPGPGLERAPVVELSWLPLVDQADDPARQPGAVVGLHAGRDKHRVAPTLLHQQLLPARSWRRRPRRRASRPRPEAEVQHHRHRACGLGRRRDGQLDVDRDLWIRGVVHVSDERFGDHRHIGDDLVGTVPSLPTARAACGPACGRRSRGRSLPRSPRGAWSTLWPM